jgi:hypothetical protein
MTGLLSAIPGGNCPAPFARQETDCSSFAAGAPHRCHNLYLRSGFDRGSFLPAEDGRQSLSERVTDL